METIKEDLNARLFDKAFMLKHRLEQVMALLGRTPDQVCLCIGDPEGVATDRLCALGGEWTFADIGPGERIEHEEAFPYKDGSFDVVVVLNRLERVEEDYAFVAECHRILKAGGLLLIDVDHLKRFTVWRPFRRLLGVDVEEPGRFRRGYTEGGLFDILKDGFDVQEARTYSRFLVEGVETLVRLLAGAMGLARGAEDESHDPTREIDRLEKLYRFRSITYPFYVAASKLDWLLFFTRGYRLTALARRKMWKTRRMPVFRDRQSLVDSIMVKKVGSAARPDKV